MTQHSLSQNRSLIALVVFLASVAAIAPSAFNNARDRMNLNDRVGGMEQDLARVEHEQQLLDSLSQLAEARYAAGCTPVLSTDGVFITLTEGATVVDRLTGEPVVDKMTICDADGNTGVTEGGKIVNTAWTGNHEIVAEAIARANDARRFVGIQEAAPNE